jgi:branched-chain amino acid transport system permease protein
VSLFVETSIGGMSLSGIYFLLAAGVTIVFGQTRNINFAHGQMMLFSAFITFDLVNNHDWNYLAAAAVAIVCVAVMAFIVDSVFLRPIDGNPFAAFMVTLGLLLILQQASVEIWGAASSQLRPIVQGSWMVNDVIIPKKSVTVIAAAAATTLAMFALLRRSRFGRAIRASAEDPLAAEHVGVRVRRVASATFMGGTALGAFAGALLALVFPISPFDGGKFIIKGFAVALVGGLGSVPGAAVAAGLLGMSETLGQAYWEPQWVPAITFVLIIGVLVIRPAGLFGRAAAATERVVSFMPPRVPRHRPWTGAATTAALGLGLLLPVFVQSFQGQTIANYAVVFGIQAAAIGLFYRLTGELSFAHGAFWALSAYVGGFISREWGWGFWTALPLAFIFTAVAALVIGIPLLRTRGLPFLLVGLAVTDFFALVLVNQRSITGGTSGITVVSKPASVLGFDFNSLRELYQLFFVILLIVLLVSWLVERSSFGRRLQAARDNEVLVRSLGLRVKTNKLLAFSLSAGLSGISGVTYLYQNFTVTPALFTGLATVFFPLMVILGGSRSVLGPPVGAFVLGFIPFWFDLGPGRTQFAYGAVLVLVMLLLRQGVVPSMVHLLNRGPLWILGFASQRSSSGPAAPVGEADPVYPAGAEEAAAVQGDGSDPAAGGAEGGDP